MHFLARHEVKRKRILHGRDARIRTWKSGFGDRHDTISSHPYVGLYYTRVDLSGKIHLVMVERTALSPRSIPERQLPKEVGSKVTLSDGTEYTISGIYGKAGLMHTALETGNWFIYWHDHNDPQMVIANGGKKGFPDIFVVRRQMIHMIDRYLGAKLEIDPQLWVDEESEGKQLTFEGLADDLKGNLEKQKQLGIPESYIISGEQNLMLDWVGLLQQTNRDIPQISGPGNLNHVREQVAKIVDKLRPATNQYKRVARQHLEEGLGGDQAKLLGTVIKAQTELLQRSQQIIGKTEGIMDRLNDLDIIQVRWNELVGSFPSTLSHIAATMDSEYNEVRRERAMKGFLNEGMGISGRLGELKGKPYYSRAQNYIEALSPVQELWQRRDLGAIKSLVDKQILSLKEWSREVGEQTTGIQFGRFAATRS